MADLVTGEAVALDIRVARLASRAIALFIDVVLQFFLLVVLVQFATATALVADSAVTAGLVVVVIVLVIVGYPTILETLTRGRTLGKLAVGLRVVSDDGGPERFRQALARALAGALEFWMLSGSPALIASLLNQRGKRLGDIFAGTIVIQERALPHTMVAVMPPALAGWASTLELSQLSDELALTARQYLTRFWELLPQVRDTMGARIVEQVTARVTPPPPLGLRPEIYLSAVLAERRRREENRLAVRLARRAAIAHRGQFQPAPPQPGTPAAALPVPGRPMFLPPAPYGVPPGPYANPSAPYGPPPSGPPVAYGPPPQPYGPPGPR